MGTIIQFPGVVRRRAAADPDRRLMEVARLLQRGYDHQLAKEYQSALAAYNEALLLDPQEPQVHYNLGILHEDLRDRAAAIRAYARCLVLAPDHASALHNLALLAPQDLPSTPPPGTVSP